MIKYSIVIPCYKSSETIGKVVTLAREELNKYLQDGQKLQFVLVNDGSPDGGKTAQIINRMGSECDDVVAIDLAKNGGQHNAIMCGLNYAEGEYIIMMDDDMQTHPSQLCKLTEAIEGDYDVVYARYPKKKHSLYRRLGSDFNSFCEKVLIGKPKELSMPSFYIMKKFVRDAMIEYRNPFTYLDGLVLRTTNNIGNVDVEHFEREVGESGYTFKKLVRHWFDIIGFTVAPLKLALTTGFAVAAGSIIAALVIIIQKLAFGVSVNGWASMMVVMCFLFGIVLMFMGFIGEYIGRIFMSSNNHPQYVIRSVTRKEQIAGQGNKS